MFCFVHSGVLFHARNVANPTRGGFLIPHDMPHCCVVSARWIYFKLGAGFFEVLLSLSTPSAKEENHIEPKSFEVKSVAG